jgi:hypothetical protein
MERRRQGSRSTTPGGVAGNVAPATTGPASSTLAHIQAVLDGGGQIMVGTIAPIKGAAVAHDGKKTLAMLQRRPQESLSALLARLDVAIASAQATGSRVDEINTASSNKRYEI